jgi:hypothetical protein
MRPGGLTDKEGAMIEYWSVVGRLVVDKTFRGEVFACRNSKNHEELVNLYKFLCGPTAQQGCALRLSRWELCDASRTAAFFEREVEKDDVIAGYIETLAAAWKNAELVADDLETTGWLGLLLIDEVLCGDYVAVKHEYELIARAEAAPVFHVAHKAKKLLKFLTGADVQDALTQLSGKSWIPPGKGKTFAAAGVMMLSAFILLFKSSRTKVQCSAGQTQLAAGDKLPYVHVLPPFVDKLAARLVPFQRKLRI